MTSLRQWAYDVTDAWGGFQAFMRDDVEKYPTLCMPLRHVWNAYKDSCRFWGFKVADTELFVMWLLDEEGIEIKIGGKGRLRRVVCGLAAKGRQ